jgi:hypothetical protein
VPSPTRPHWNAHDIRSAVALLVTRDGTNCWLCGHPTHRRSRSIDHVIPYTHRPDLDQVPTNWRLAHLNSAGTERGCSTADCSCPGNTGRRHRPATPPPSRSW